MRGNFKTAAKYYNSALSHAQERKSYYEASLNRYSHKKSKIQLFFDEYISLLEKLELKLNLLHERIGKKEEEKINRDLNVINAFRAKNQYDTAISMTKSVLRRLRENNLWTLIDQSRIHDLKEQVLLDKRALFLSSCDKGDAYFRKKNIEKRKKSTKQQKKW